MTNVLGQCLTLRWLGLDRRSGNGISNSLPAVPMNASKDSFVYTDVSYFERRSKRAERILSVALWAIFLQACIYSCLGYWLMVPIFIAAQLTFLALSFFAIVIRTKISFESASHITFILAFAFACTARIWLEGDPPGFEPVTHYWFAVIGIGSWFIFRNHNRSAGAIYIVVCLATFTFFEITSLTVTPILEMSASDHFIARKFTKFGVVIVMFSLVYTYLLDIMDAEDQLSLSNDRLEELLENMLPVSISKRLRKEGKTFADGYTNTSVLFADMAGFTSMSAAMKPMAIVELLDELFSAFDRITEDLGLEKIKTIGDAYMVAAGLPEPRDDHAAAIVELALRMRAEVSKFSGVHVRIGINSGEVVAGIIGKKRFIYDLWGDTVNIASRMESHGVVDEIQISETTYAVVKDSFDCESRGSVELKGRGAMEVYLVRGRKVSEGNVGQT